MIRESTIPSPFVSFKTMKEGVIPFDLTIRNREKEYKCHSVVACAVSKKFLETVNVNAPQKRVDIAIPDEYNMFSMILDFFYGFDYTITPHNAEVTYLFASVLQIQLLLEPSKEVMERSFSNDTVIPSLYFIYEAKGDITPHLEYIRANFSDMMYQSDMMGLPVPVLDQILESEELNIDNEDSIAFWVSRLIKERGKSCSRLVDRIFLGSITDKSLIELVGNEEVDAHTIVESRNKQRTKPEGFAQRHCKASDFVVDEMRQKNNYISIDLPEDKSVNGIMNYIIKHQRSGVQEIRIEVSGIHDKYFLPQNLFDFENTHTCWYSGETHGTSWVLFDLSPRMLKPTAYTFRTSGGNKNEGHLKSWVITATNDRREWVQIDQRIDTVELNGSYKSVTFMCQAPKHYRVIKIEQIGPNHHKDNSMILSTVEFFGELVPLNLT